MPPTKKNAVTKTANRPCKGVAPADATMMASTSFSRSIKNGVKGSVTKTRSNKGNNFIASAYLNVDNDEDDDYKPYGIRSKSIDSEFDHDMAEDSDDEYIAGKKAKSKATRNSKQKAKANTKSDNKVVANNKVKCQTETKTKTKKDGTLPDPHGRVKGRDLIPWTRPRMFEKLLLHLQYEAELAGIKLPWDAAVHRLHVGSNTGAATQQLAKLREILLTEGHMVPPKAKVKNKRGVEYHSQMRGYIRPDGSGDPYEARIVGWGEKIVDLAKSIENPGIYRGSGRYPRITGPDQATSVSGTSPPPKKSRGARSTATKPKLMVTLKLNPKHLSKFPTDSGDAQHVNNPQTNLHGDTDSNITVQGDAESVGEIENGIGDMDDDGSEEQKSGSEINSDDESDEDSRAELIKQEEFPFDEDAQKEMHGVTNEATGSLFSQTGISLNSSIGGNMNATAVSSTSFDGLTTANFDPMVGTLTNPNHFETLPAFSPSAGAFGAHHLMYSSGALNQYNMYTGPSMLGSNSYISPAAFTMGMPTGMANGYGMGMTSHSHPSQSYYQGPNIGQTSTIGAFQPSGGASLENDYECHGSTSGPHGVKDEVSSTYGRGAVGDGDDTEEKPYDSTPSLAYPSGIFGSGSADDDDDDDDNDIFDSFLQHEVFSDDD